MASVETNMKKYVRVKPGAAEDAYFQKYAHMKKINAVDAIVGDPNPAGASTPTRMLVLAKLDSTRMRSILEEGED